MNSKMLCAWPDGGRRSSQVPFLTLALAACSIWVPVAHAAALDRRQGDPIAGGVDLRLLAIGDSITYGAGSPFCPVGAPAEQCNGYRKPLYESLSERGNNISFVGGVSAGDFAQPLCEGHRGERIDEITEHSLVGIYAAPNVVLLHAGTNDVKDDQDDYPDVHDHLQDLISLVYDRSPDALVLLCTIIPADPEGAKETAERIPDFNEKIPDVVSYFEDKDKKIRLVDMNSALDLDDLSDSLHPNAGGYEKMAKAFLEAIEEAEDDISEPIQGSDPPDLTMITLTSSSSRRATPSWYRPGRVARGIKAGISFFA